MKYLIILLVILSSCSSVKKNSSLTIKSLDSTSVNKSEEKKINYSDNSVENYMASDSSEEKTQHLKIDFDNSDSATTTKDPIKIINENGITTIDVGNRKVKAITQATTNKSKKKEVVNEKKNDINTTINKEKKSDSTAVKKNEKQVINSKNAFRINWWWVIVAIIIGGALYYKYKK